MSHIDNIREMEKLGYEQKYHQRKGYLKALKETEKEVKELKKKIDNLDGSVNNSINELPRMIDKIFTHKEAITEGEK